MKNDLYFDDFWMKKKINSNIIMCMCVRMTSEEEQIV